MTSYDEIGGVRRRSCFWQTRHQNKRSGAARKQWQRSAPGSRQLALPAAAARDRRLLFDRRTCTWLFSCRAFLATIVPSLHCRASHPASTRENAAAKLSAIIGWILVASVKFQMVSRPRRMAFKPPKKILGDRQ